MMASHAGEPTLFGLTMPWLNKKDEIVQERYEPHASNARMTRREQELQRDLQNMANKCVDLQVELNETKLMMGSICNRSGDLQKKKLVQETLTLAKERDRMIHHAKAAAWKLQEVRKVGELFVSLISTPHPSSTLFSFMSLTRCCRNSQLN